jgi:hypothetical protein
LTMLSHLTIVLNDLKRRWSSPNNRPMKADDS